MLKRLRAFLNKPKKIYSDFLKVLSVSVSCLTAEQCDTATKLVELYVRRYASEEKSGLLKLLCPKIIEYLHDTKEHCLQRAHYPAWNNGKGVQHHPDINDYMAPLLGFKMKRF